MNSRLLILVLSLVMLSASSDPAKSVYPNRWVRIGTNLGDDQELERVLKIIQTEHPRGVLAEVFEQAPYDLPLGTHLAAEVDELGFDEIGSQHVSIIR